MSSFDIHMDKHEMFKKDAENEDNSTPTRIEAYFNSCFHLIEACAARHRIHINKHQLVRPILENVREIFEEDTERVWRAFQEIENQVRPAQVYGGRIDGEALEKVKELIIVIEDLCNNVLRKGI